MDPCELCGRTCFQQGNYCQIEAAWTLHGEERATDFIKKIIEDSKAKGKAKREKAKDMLADIALRFERYSRTGKLKIPRELKRDVGVGIHCIKTPDVRLFFFECENAPEGGLIRITHAMFKLGDHYSKGEIDQAQWVKKGDVSHG